MCHRLAKSSPGIQDYLCSSVTTSNGQRCFQVRHTPKNFNRMTMVISELPYQIKCVDAHCRKTNKIHQLIAYRFCVHSKSVQTLPLMALNDSKTSTSLRHLRSVASRWLFETFELANLKHNQMFTVVPIANERVNTGIAFSDAV